MACVYRLANGLRFILERRPTEKRTSIVIGINRGASDEPRRLAGALHYFEHLATMRYPESESIAESIDRMAGEYDAWTTSDLVLFSLVVRNRETLSGLRIITEPLLRPPFTDDDIEKERGVILQEMSSEAGSPDLLLDTLRERLLYKKSALTRPAYGRAKVIARMTREEILGLWRRVFDPRNIVVTVVGRFNKAKVMRVVRDLFGSLKPPSRPLPKRKSILLPPPEHRLSLRRASTDDVRLALTTRLPGYATHRRFTFMVLANIVGGRLSSPLFRYLRRKGLIYGLDSSIWFYPEVGHLTIQTATNRRSVLRLLTIVRRYFREYCEKGVPPFQFRLAIDSMVADALKRFDNTSYAARFYTGQLLAHGHIIGLQRYIKTIRRLGRHRVNLTASIILDERRWSLVAVGPLTRGERKRLRAFFENHPRPDSL